MWHHSVHNERSSPRKKMANRIHRRAVKAIALSIMGCAAGPVGSAGFEIFGQNPLGGSAAFAGGAAVAEDASIAHYNPAAMIGLDPSKRHIAGALGLARLSTRYRSDGGSVAPVFTVLGNDDGGNGGEWNLVGNAAM